MSPTTPRPLIAGPPTPEPPFPIRLSGPIIKGFGRGSKELGIPTANIPIAGLILGGHEEVESGAYYGWAGVNVNDHGHKLGNVNGERSHDGEQKERGGVWPMVMSIGWNPFYKNPVRSVPLSLDEQEVHIVHDFPNDFYGAHMNLLILGFIRPELDYVSKESLIADIKFDIEVAQKSLEREAYVAFKTEDFLHEHEEEGHEKEIASS